MNIAAMARIFLTLGTLRYFYKRVHNVRFQSGQNTTIAQLIK
jgi:hypothetical protein